MYVAILGRQPALGMAELERVYSEVTWLSDTSARVNTDSFDLSRLGGTLKAGRIVAEISGDWRTASTKIVQHYIDEWSHQSGKLTIGISAYGFSVSAREVQKVGIVLKAKLKPHGVNLRLIPNDEPALTTATSHHNKLGLANNKIELLIVHSRNGRIIIAESIGAQNITAYARRDQERPKRDAFVGMLPPKLAQIMINLAIGDYKKDDITYILDPFCGTGVILQEALIMGFGVYGSDIEPKMIDYTQANLEWLKQRYNHLGHVNTIRIGDATKYAWDETDNLSGVITETYLGQPFSAPPSPSKLAEVRGNCNHIVVRFLENMAMQLHPGVELCIAVPAWRSSDGSFTHLPCLGSLGALGYKVVGFKNVRPEDLLYYRETQVVARELLVLVKA